MRKAALRLSLYHALFLLAAFSNLSRADVILSEESEWRYWKGTAEASSPVCAWRFRDFDDAAWSTGPGPFYYEDSSGYSGNTALADMRRNYTCVFLRKSFWVGNPAAAGDFTLYLQSDDGCVVWLNGTNVARVNMPEGEPLVSWTSLPAAGEPNVATVIITNAGRLLHSGDNILAIQAFNSSLANSSDFYMAASLSGNFDVQPPALDSVNPAPDARVRTLDTVEVFFTESVTGVDSTDLLVNGVPAIGLNVVSPRAYTFTFPQPAPGTVSMSWAADAGIRDLARNPFGGSAWSYELDTNTPRADVIISEFLAQNDNGLRDNFGSRSDWIELLNRSEIPAELDGCYLTDDAGDLTKWRIPAVTMEPGAFLLIWASGEDQANPLAPLHTNFKLAPAGEYLALVDRHTNVVSEFAPAYPDQRPDISYGRDQTSPALVGYYATPTPGTPNAAGGPGFAPDPVFSLAGGVYTNASLSVTLSAPSGVIRYTIDGTRPTTNSPIYSGAISLTRSMVIHARVFEAGLLPSTIIVQTYTLLGSGLLAFSSNLPLLIINTSGRAIQQETRTLATVTAIEPFRGRATLLTPPELQRNCQVEVRGQSSTSFPKLAYNLELNDSNGNDSDFPLLGLPSESDWVLYNPYSDKPFLQNFLAYELHEKMGHYAPRRRFVEVFVDTTSGRLEYPGDYKGIYILVEKIKVDPHRVDIARLSSQQNAEPELSGGYIIKKDKDSPGDYNFSTSGGAGFSGQGLKLHEPKPREATVPQKTWIRNYLLQFEKALYATTWLTGTGTNHYSHYIDADSFVDNHWIVEFAKQIDGYRLSNYMSKDRGGKLRMEPIWDWNLSFGNADYLNGADPNGWYYTLIDANAHIWLRRLMCGTTSSGGTTGDPDFNQKIADRWSVLRTNIFAATNVLRRIDELAAQLNEAQMRDFARWPRLGSYVWPNPPLYSTPTTYAGIIANMKNWVLGRYNWIDSQFLKPPQLSHESCGVSPGFTLSASAPAGTIYYTTDGTDPRAPGGGQTAGVRTYSGGIVIQANSRVVARARNGNLWSGPAAATFTVEVPPLVLTELMYAPEPAPGLAADDPGRFEYLELLNAGAQTLDLRGFHFTRGIEFAFATGAVASLAPGERVVVARDPAALATRYGDLTNVTGPYTGALANEGERITLVGPMLETVFDVSYSPDWFPATDGLGFALVPADEAQPRRAWATAAGWRAGTVPGGTPGMSEPAAPAFPRVVVNEVLTHTDPPLSDSIELLNLGATEADIGGWFLSDDRRTPKYRIPPGTRLQPGACYLRTEADFNSTPDVPPSFDLRAAGEEVFLFSADADGHLTGYSHGYSFGAALNGVSFGRHITSTGEEHFVAQAARSLGQANGPSKVGPVVITEIHYRPPDVFANNAWWDNTEDEFIELCNVSAETVILFDPDAPTNTWRLRDAVRYTFPTNQTLNPGARVLVVPFDPTADPARAAAFRTRFGLAQNLPLFGPFKGKLANSSDSVELIQPDSVRMNATNLTSTSVLADKVAYRDDPPWPSGADGLGFSLQRRLETAYGNDPANWVAASPTPGAPCPPAAAPVILAGPLDQTVFPGSSVVLSVDAAGPPPLSCQWRHNGENLAGATAAVLTLTNVQPSQGGLYHVVVSTPTSSTASAMATLKVGRPPTIVQSPVSRRPRLGDTVTFSVIAFGTPPLEYQWRRNGTALTGRTGAALQFPGVDLAAEGTYDVVVTDGVGFATTSSPASLVLDTDGDGIPDSWELNHQLNPLDPMDARVDADSDGATNLEEYLAGTDPRDSSSVLRVEQIDVVGPVTIRFRCSTSRSYTLLYRNTMEPAQWNSLTNIAAIEGAGEVTRLFEVTDPGAAGVAQRYYRLRTPALQSP